MQLARQGQLPGTVFVPLRKDDNPATAYAHVDGTAPSPGADASKAAKSKLQRAEFVNRADPHDKEDLTKALGEIGAA